MLSKLVVIWYPCGDRIYVSEKDWGYPEEEDGANWALTAPFERCKLCFVDNIEMVEGEKCCKPRIFREEHDLELDEDAMILVEGSSG